MLQDTSILRARLEAAVAMDAPAKPERLTIALLATLYLAHAQAAYTGRHGKKEQNTIRQSLEPLTTLYGDLPPESFRPLHLRAARQFWIEAGRSRSTIQARMARVRQCWRWARSVELIDTDLPAIEHVRFGHAREKEPIAPVDPALMESTLPFLSPTARVMLKVLLLTGMRPGELADCQSHEIERAKVPWVYRPSEFKTRRLGHTREIFIGPRAVLLLQPYLKPGYLFTTKSGKRWTANLLYNAVRKACIKHGLQRWHPNMCRHTAATDIRRTMGLDAAQALLGHASIDSTQIYAVKQTALALEAARRFG